MEHIKQLSLAIRHTMYASIKLDILALFSLLIGNIAGLINQLNGSVVYSDIGHTYGKYSSWPQSNNPTVIEKGRINGDILHQVNYVKGPNITRRALLYLTWHLYVDSHLKLFYVVIGTCPYALLVNRSENMKLQFFKRGDQMCWLTCLKQHCFLLHLINLVSTHWIIHVIWNHYRCATWIKATLSV